MSTNEKLLQQVNAILIERSKKAIESAKKVVSQEHIKDLRLREALDYFMEEICADASHPTLLSLACEAVGGNPDETVGVAKAIVLLTGAADIHDDIIDQSQTKDLKPTIYGKFGKDIAIVAADVLWIKGMLTLNDECEHFQLQKKQAILSITKQAFFDIGSAEAKEASLRGNFDLIPEELLDIVKMKVSVAVAAAQIGAIIGDGTVQQIENLGQYAKTLGVLMTLREEFINMFEPDELKNRFKNECLPLPFLCAFRDANLKQKILEFLEKDDLSKAKLNEILEKIYDNAEVCKLGKYMHLSAKEAYEKLQYEKKIQDELTQLLNFSLQDMPS
jgi:geranylgeranyl pyrophosphate synthase